MWRIYDIWLDCVGNTRLVSNNYAAAPFGNLDAELRSISNAVIWQTAQGTVTTFALVPANATYASVFACAYVTVVDSSGNEAAILVPAPKLSIFEADAITVTPTVLGDILSAASADGYVLANGNPPAAAPTGMLRMSGKQR